MTAPTPDLTVEQVEAVVSALDRFSVAGEEDHDAEDMALLHRAGFLKASEVGGYVEYSSKPSDRSLEQLYRAFLSLTKDNARLKERVKEMEGALSWYVETVADCRKIHSEGDAARKALDKDGGRRARQALNGQSDEQEEWRSIEHAPKTGERFLAKGVHGTLLVTRLCKITNQWIGGVATGNIRWPKEDPPKYFLPLSFLPEISDQNDRHDH